MKLIYGNVEKPYGQYQVENRSNQNHDFPDETSTGSHTDDGDAYYTTGSGRGWVAQLVCNDSPSQNTFRQEQEAASEGNAMAEVVEGNGNSINWVLNVALETSWKFWVGTLGRIEVNCGAGIDIFLRKFEPDHSLRNPT
jgi:hypothetical protein